jgi:hypothetical protein
MQAVKYSYNESRPFKHLCTALFKNYYVTRQLLESSASNYLEITKPFPKKFGGNSYTLPLQVHAGSGTHPATFTMRIQSVTGGTDQTSGGCSLC